MSLDEATAERIFDWTNGNPRMTWDVCSAVENIAKKETVNPSQIDKLVTQIYLSTFDKPPIDTIRELVKHDREIRNALTDIELTKGKGISDRVKSKLYLAGIINFEENKVQVKNNVIQKCLNRDWLRSLEIDEKGLFDVALELLNKGKFQEAVEIYEKFLEGSDIDEEQKNLSYYNMAYASIKLSNFEQALNYSELTEFDREENAKLYYGSKIQKGQTNYYLNNIEKSLAYFREVIDSGRKDENYLRAIINYGTISINSDLQSHKEKATKIFDDIINEVGFDRKRIKESFIRYLKFIAHFNLSKIFKHNNNLIKAKENLYLALELSEENSRPIIILNLLDLEEQVKEKKNLLSQIVELLNADKIRPIEPDIEKPLEFTFNQLIEVFLSAYKIDKENIFNQLKDKLNLLGDKKYSTHLYELAVFAINTKNYETTIAILKEIYTNRSKGGYEIDDNVFYSTLKLLAYFVKDKRSYSVEYLALFREERLEPVDYFDFENIANLIWHLTEKRKHNEALKYVDLINSVKSEVSSDLLINYLPILYFELLIYVDTNNPKQISKAKEVIEFANSEEIKHQHSNLLGDTGLEIIKQQAEEIINPRFRKVAPIIIGKTYGKNQIVKVKYKDGKVSTAKYKKIEASIKTGECTIID